MNDDPSAPSASANFAVVPPQHSAPVAGRSPRPVKAKNNGLALCLAFTALAGAGGIGWLYLQQQFELQALEAAQATLQAQNADALAQLEALQQNSAQEDNALEQSLTENVQAALQRSQQQSVAEIESAQAELQAELQAGIRAYLQTEMRATSNRLDTQQGQLEALTREVASISQRIASTSGAGEAEQDWLLGEAESLLRLAQQQVLLGQDVQAAARLFVAADELLGSSDNAAVFTVRELLASELAALQALQLPDVAELHAALGEQSERIGNLPVQSDDNAETPSLPEPEQDTLETVGGWLDAAKQSLSQYFVVTKRDAAIEPLVTAEQQVLVRRSIQLQIEQARLALLQRQPAVYLGALDAAIAGIEQRLEQNEDSAAVTAALAELRDAPVNIDIPQVNATLAALQRVRAAAGGAAQ